MSDMLRPLIKIPRGRLIFLSGPPPPLNCHQLLNNDTSGVVDSVVNSKKHLANCAKEEITKLKTEPLDATSAAMTSATQQPSFHVRFVIFI